MFGSRVMRKWGVARRRCRGEVRAMTGCSRPSWDTRPLPRSSVQAILELGRWLLEIGEALQFDDTVRSPAWAWVRRAP